MSAHESQLCVKHPRQRARSCDIGRLREVDTAVLSDRRVGPLDAPTLTPQSKPVTHASRLVAQDCAPLVAFGLGPGILAAGPVAYRHYSYRRRYVNQTTIVWLAGALLHSEPPDAPAVHRRSGPAWVAGISLAAYAGLHPCQRVTILPPPPTVRCRHQRSSEPDRGDPAAQSRRLTPRRERPRCQRTGFDRAHRKTPGHRR